MREAEFLVTMTIDGLDVEGHSGKVGYVRFTDEPVHHTDMWAEQIFADIDIDGRVVGIEFLDAKKMPYVPELCDT